jgi:hypothetical protein
VPEEEPAPARGKDQPSLGRKLLLWLAVAVSVGAITIVVLLLFDSLGEKQKTKPTESTGSTPVGFLSVKVSRPAVLFIDGEQIPEQAPVQKKILPVGRHRVVVKADDGRVLLDETVRIRKGTTRVLRVNKPVTRKKIRKKKRSKIR